jgi:hypothetical protein
VDPSNLNSLEPRERICCPRRWSFLRLFTVPCYQQSVGAVKTTRAGSRGVSLIYIWILLSFCIPHHSSVSSWSTILKVPMARRRPRPAGESENCSTDSLKKASRGRLVASLKTYRFHRNFVVSKSERLSLSVTEVSSTYK